MVYNFVKTGAPMNLKTNPLSNGTGNKEHDFFDLVKAVGGPNFKRWSCEGNISLAAEVVALMGHRHSFIS